MTLDINKRLKEAKEEGSDFVAASLILPGMPQLIGELRRGSHEGLFVITSIVKLGDTGKAGPMDFNFTADKVVSLLYPNTTPQKEESSIIVTH